jgi:hypothetical protein
MSDDTSTDTPAHQAAHGAGHASGIHLPPNSWAPISTAFALSLIFVGFLTDIRATIGPVGWLVGLVWLVVSLAVWAIGARREYLGLPEDHEH